MENNGTVTTNTEVQTKNKPDAGKVLGYVNTGFGIATGAVGLTIGIIQLCGIIGERRQLRRARKEAERAEASSNQGSQN